MSPLTQAHPMPRSLPILPVTQKVYTSDVSVCVKGDFHADGHTSLFVSEFCLIVSALSLCPTTY